MDGQKHEECTIFLSIVHFPPSLSNAHHIGCHERVSGNEDVTLQLLHLCQLCCDIAVRRCIEERTSPRSFSLEIVPSSSNLLQKSI